MEFNGKPTQRQAKNEINATKPNFVEFVGIVMSCMPIFFQGSCGHLAFHICESAFQLIDFESENGFVCVWMGRMSIRRE